MNPRVSVIIPTFNRAADLRRALTAVRAQTLADWEAIVVDNRSRDETRQVVEGFRDERIRMIEVDNQGIVAYSRNTGMRAARAEFIALLDSDDWWKPRKLAVCLEALGAGADLAYHDLYLVHSQRQRFFWRKTRTRAVRTPVFADLLQQGNAVANSGAVVRRQLLLDIGGFSEDRHKVGYEDFDAWLRIARLTDKFVKVRGTLGYYWKGGNNLLTPDRTLRNLEDFRTNYLGTTEAGRDDLPGWYHYGLGRAYYHLGEWPNAAAHMRQARRGRLLPAERAKSILTSAVVALRRRPLGMSQR